MLKNSLAISGIELIRKIHLNIPNQSGIYKMLDITGQIIYIGKAKNLKQRLYSYSLKTHNPRTYAMVQNIYKIEWVITNSEYDALLLESSLIKQIQPKYNILLKDDRQFPFIKIETDHPFPRILVYKSKQATPTKNIFGPFASTYYVKENIKLLQQIFQLRTCTDSFFNNREKPCILYQIKRCSAPCVKKIKTKDYTLSINQAMSFLKGNNLKVKEDLINTMKQASKQQDFERAIILRERIKLLQNNHHKQSIILQNQSDADFIALMEYNGQFIYNIFMFRYGYNHGSVNFIIPIPLQDNLEEALRAFLIQFYNKREIPKNIYTNIALKDSEILQDVKGYLNNKSGKRINIKTPNSTLSKNIMEIVIHNTLELIKQQEQVTNKWVGNFQALAELFKIKNPITRIELYDNSHLYGTFPLGAMVCATPAGFSKKDYRTFYVKNENIQPNDDYAILAETLIRRFNKLTPENTPQLIFIDGGKGQLSTAKSIATQLNLTDIKIIAIGKGPNRNAGEETLYLNNKETINLPRYSATLHFIQMLRNEVHRFAITSLRKRKLKSLTTSELSHIAGIGVKRKKDLLTYFGSIENIRNATITELTQVKGVSVALATKIFNWFH